MTPTCSSSTGRGTGAQPSPGTALALPAQPRGTYHLSVAQREKRSQGAAMQAPIVSAREASWSKNHCFIR
jgi:hypothetical protein